MSSLISEQERVVARVQAAIKAIQNKGMVIMVDDEDRENEGDLVLAAELCQLNTSTSWRKKRVV